MPSKKNKHKKKHQQPAPPPPPPPPTRQPNRRPTETGTSSLPYQVQNSSVMGRYIAASRDLRAGELLITEPPLAIGPCVSADAVCLGCYRPVTLASTQYRCSACRWPLCDAKCRGLHQSDGHTAHECTLLQTQNTPLSSAANAVADQLTLHASPATVKNLYELILITRILAMKCHAPEKYATILEMESHTEMRKQNAELWEYYAKNVVTRLRHEWKLADNFTDEEIHRICGILDVNCFEIGQNGAKARALYPSAFLLAHDCRPNTSHTDHPETYAIILRTSRRVPKGDAITLSYAYTLQGTLKRRDFMHAGKLFWCTCERCTDPSELGTDCSGIVCAECTQGTLRPSQPLEQTAEWRCDRCVYKLNASEVLRLLDKINNDLEMIDVHDVPGLENFLRRYREVLRTNHYLLLSAKYSLCQIYGRIEGYLLPHMSLEDIKRKERYCREFLAVVDILEPGLTRLRGLIMYELHAPIMVQSQRLMQQNLISRQDFQRNLKEVVRLLRDSRDILTMEPAGSNEHQMGVAAADALEKMGCK